ncbi:MAG: DNA polymerase III subunit gamma/tau [Candidatus Omnitrophica bacterium]|nr:DNA polymerase III subunit gamma/tau [Candidatus Omnitrophota bacterium]
MSYLVLARKHRPPTFDDVIGQAHITDLLKKAITSDKVSHAYLFCGPRGVGKTSCARILAKSLNCEKGPVVKPCGKCPACVDIAKGNSFDVLEIDGASNRGIDEIRLLRENVKFAASGGKYKIYIVDEVHMLTTEAFNALLKTLEEPPEHVKFIFATTEPNKVPATIMSRCQRYDFKRISIKTITDNLTKVSQAEKYKIEDDALFAIAKAAQGSMRDGLSILDQLSALSDGGIKADDVFGMLGLVETQFLFDLTDALIEHNCLQGLETLNTIVDSGKDSKELTKDLTEHFRHLMVIKIGGKTLGKLVDYPVAVKEMLLSQTQKIELGDILNAIEVLIKVQETSRVTESVRMPLEFAFAQLTYTDEQKGAAHSKAAKADTKSAAAVPPKTNVYNEKGSVEIRKENSSSQQGDLETKDINSPAMDRADQQPSGEGKKAADNQAEPESSAETMAGEHPAGKVTDYREGYSNAENAEDINLDRQHEQAEQMMRSQDIDLDLEKIRHCWDAMTHAVSRQKMFLASYLQEGAPVFFENGKLTIGFPQSESFQKESLEDAEYVKIIESVFTEQLNQSIQIKYVINENFVPPKEDDSIEDALKAFDGKIVNKWHNE